MRTTRTTAKTTATIMPVVMLIRTLDQKGPRISALASALGPGPAAAGPDLALLSVLRLPSANDHEEKDEERQQPRQGPPPALEETRAHIRKSRHVNPERPKATGKCSRGPRR